MLDIIMGNNLIKAAVTDVGIQWSLFIVASALKTEKFYDLAGSGTFLLLAVKSLQWGNRYFTRQKVQTGCIAIWALRLGLYLFTRVLKDGKDRRFDKIKVDMGRFFIAWTLQALWVYLTLLPTLILNDAKRDTPISSRDYVGWGLWAVGFLLEFVADYQKSSFRADPENAGKFIQSGLWSISRHPNYFGEIMLWSGLFISASSVMKGNQFLSVLSPVFITLLLTKVSGVPLLEKHGMKKWGHLVEYNNYLRNTAVLVPYIW